MGNPNIQNDFSYYRRTLSRMRMSNPGQQNVVVQDELANRMSLFYAHSTPMTKSLIDSSIMLVSSVRSPVAIWGWEGKKRGICGRDGRGIVFFILLILLIFRKLE